MNVPSGFALYRPRAVGVRAVRGAPQAVDASPVEAVREEWLIEDRWWTPDPLRRHYFELILSSGRCLVVFHDLARGGWYSQ